MKVERLEDYSLKKNVSAPGQSFKLGIVGCGNMGQEIALAASAHSIEVVFVDVSDARIEIIMQSMENKLEAMINRWGMTGSEKKLILSRIEGFIGYEVLHDCSMVIECVNSKKPINNLDLRQQIFKNIEAVVEKNTVIASNASTVVVDDLSVVLDHPERAIGIHFIDPAYQNKIVEVNSSYNTSKETYNKVVKFVKMIDKEVINIHGTPGNISTRLIIPLINEACELLMEGVSTVEEIDKAMQIGFGLQLGPFAMADKIGLDKLVKWMEGLYNEYGEKRYKTSPLIKRLVRSKMFGVRSGEGFYKYEDEKRIIKEGTILNLGRVVK